MIPYPHISPEIFRIGPFAVRWYGMMYVLGFASSYLLVLHQVRRAATGITKAQIDDIYFYLVWGCSPAPVWAMSSSTTCLSTWPIPSRYSCCGTAACPSTVGPSARSSSDTGR